MPSEGRIKTLQSRIKILLLLTGAVLGFSILGLCLGLWYWNYGTWTTCLLTLTGKEGWRSYFETSVFPEHRFVLLQYGSVLFFLLWILGFRWLYVSIEQLSHHCGYFLIRTKEGISNSYQSICSNTVEKRFLAVLLAFFLVRSLVQIHYYALQYDEAWTYNHFISKGFIVSAISPNNNHVLYTLLACLTDYLPFDIQYTLRVPVLFGGLLTIGLFYTLMRHFFDWKVVLLGLVWLVVSPSIVFYSMYARGYIFQIMATCLGVWASLKLVEPKKDSAYYWQVWIVAMLIGLYSVPTHAYVWLVLNIFLLGYYWQQRNLKFKNWIGANVVVGLVIIVLYSPLLLTNGLDFLINVAVADTAPTGEAFWSYQDKVADWLLAGGGRGTAVYWFLVLLIIVMLCIAYLSKGIEQSMALLVVLFLFFPSFQNLIIGTQPPYRVWCFLAVPLAMAFVLLAKQINLLQQYYSLLIVSVGIIAWGIWRTEVHYAVCWSADLDQEARKIANILMEEKVATFYTFSHYDKPLLECYYKYQDKNLSVQMFDENSKDYAPFIHGKQYDAVLWDKEDRVGTVEEQTWLEEHYPILMYENTRIQIRKGVVSSK